MWIKYNETKDKKIKQSLIENYISLVRIVAGRMYNYYGSKIEYDDLVSFGVMGLIDSIDKFDIEKNIKFETYAQIRVKGAMIDNIRKLDWIPRSLRKKSKDVQNAIYKLENQLGRSPTNEETAKYLEMPLEELEILLSDIATFNVSSLEEMLINRGDYSFDIKQDSNTPEEIYESKEIKRLLAVAIDSLLENEKMVISLYYYDELTYKEIGHVMELSESRISQIHSKAILKMKNFLIKEGIRES
nr:FliA/WhiG family RNA polymerase sigma factor [Tissierella simiarum]